MKNTIVIGGGLAGCLYASIDQSAIVYEPFTEPTRHKAVLRFESPDIGDAIGIPFHKVKVYKGIWHNDQHVPVTPRAIALYSRKVSDTIAHRSIQNIDPVYRWIAPTNFHDVLLDMLSSRIEYGVSIGDALMSTYSAAISTVPLPVLADFGSVAISGLDKSIRNIYISRWRIPNCDAHLTNYYTDPTVLPYRASIVGDELIIESMYKIEATCLATVTRSFGLTGMELEQLVDNHVQNNGKLTSIDERARRDFITRMTEEYNIYSLGRFATWRNIKMDDILDDIHIIRAMMNKDKYDLMRGK